MDYLYVNSFKKIEIDLREAVGAADDNANALKILRQNIDVEFHKMFEKQKYLIIIKYN